jgi:hypothetical protein
MLKTQRTNIETLADCWLHAYATCNGELKYCHVFLSVAQWLRLCKASRFNLTSAEKIAHQGSAYVHVFDEPLPKLSEEAVTFYIRWDWTNEILILARE